MNIVVNVMENATNAALMVFVFVVFFRSFCNYKINGGRYIVIMLSSTIVLFFTLMWVQIRVARVLAIIVVTLFISTIYDAKWYNKLLLSLSIIAIASISEMIVSLFQSWLFSVDWKENGSGILFVLGGCSSKLLTIIFTLVIRNFISPRFGVRVIRETLIVGLIPFSSISIITLICFYLELGAVQDDLIILITLVCVCTFTFLNIVVFNFVDKLYHEAEKDALLRASSEIIHQQSIRYRQLIESNMEIAQIRHDQNNFTLGLISELERGNYDSALKSLYKQVRKIKQSSDLYRENSIVQLIVDQKSMTASELGIAINLECCDLSQISISAVDLSIILGNALDNAVEAVQNITSNDEKNIYVSVKAHNNNLVINVRNSVAYDIDAENLQTTKNGKYHGYGITSIKQLVEKYNGDIVFTCKDRVFEVHIILKNTND